MHMSSLHQAPHGINLVVETKTGRVVVGRFDAVHGFEALLHDAPTRPMSARNPLEDPSGAPAHEAAPPHEEEPNPPENKLAPGEERKRPRSPEVSDPRSVRRRVSNAMRCEDDNRATGMSPRFCRRASASAKLSPLRISPRSFSTRSWNVTWKGMLAKSGSP